MAPSLLSRQIYKSRIDKVISFIHENLGEKLSLKVLAEVACFSPYHFHRLFTSIVDETPNEFVNRLRLERAAGMLINNPKHSITEIAFDCGFSSSASFSRAFKQYFGFSATDLRNNIRRGENGSSLLNSKIGKTNSNKWKDKDLQKDYFELSNSKDSNNQKWRSKMDVNVQHLSTLRIAYVANMEGYTEEKICIAWNELCKWAGARDLLGKDTKYIGISFDDPDITPANKCRYYACVTIPDDVEADDTIGIMELAEGKYGVHRFEGFSAEMKHAYKFLYSEWLPNSGYQPDDRVCYEIYYSTPEKHPEGKFIMDICMPVIPL